MIALSASLLLGGGRRGLTRLLLIVAGVAVGVVFLLGALAIGPARDLQDARVALRQYPPGAAPSTTRPALLWDATRSSFGAIGSRSLAVIEVAATGRGAPLPLGADRIPEPARCSSHLPCSACSHLPADGSIGCGSPAASTARSGGPSCTIRPSWWRWWACRRPAWATRRG